MAFESREGLTRGAQVAIPRVSAAAEAGFLRGVYGWMAGGLALTAVVALFTASSPALLQAIFGNRIVFYALLFGELGLVLAVTGAINRLSPAAAPCGPARSPVTAVMIEGMLQAVTPKQATEAARAAPGRPVANKP